MATSAPVAAAAAPGVPPPAVPVRPVRRVGTLAQARAAAAAAAGVGGTSSTNQVASGGAPAGPSTGYLFDHFVVVQVEEKRSGKSTKVEPAVTYHFARPGSNPLPAETTSFCCPDADLVEKSNGSVYASEDFAFTLTAADGSRTFGFCTRFLPIGATARFPIVLCLVGTVPVFGLAQELLKALHVRWLMQPSAVFPLLHGIAKTPLPPPGGLFRGRVEAIAPSAAGTADSGSANSGVVDSLALSVSAPGSSSGSGGRAGTAAEGTVGFGNEVITLHRESSTVIDTQLQPIFAALSVENVIRVFSALLLEQRVVFVSQELPVLSRCIHAAMGMLHPLEWQHVFVPLLSPALINYACAPFPICIGLRAQHLPLLLALPIDDTVIVDLDKDSVSVAARRGRKAQAGAATFSFPMPPALTEKLVSALKRAGGAKAPSEQLYACFLAFFVTLLSPSRWWACLTGRFQKAALNELVAVWDPKAAETREFVSQIWQSQLFDVFINATGKKLQPFFNAPPTSLQRDGMYAHFTLIEQLLADFANDRGTSAGYLDVLKLITSQAAAGAHGGAFSLFGATVVEVKRLVTDLTSNGNHSALIETAAGPNAASAHAGAVAGCTFSGCLAAVFNPAVQASAGGSASHAGGLFAVASVVNSAAVASAAPTAAASSSAPASSPDEAAGADVPEGKDEESPLGTPGASAGSTTALGSPASAHRAAASAPSSASGFQDEWGDDPWLGDGHATPPLTRENSAQEPRAGQAAPAALSAAAPASAASAASKAARLQALRSLVAHSFDARYRAEVLAVLLARLKDTKASNWKSGAQALSLLELLLFQGCDTVVLDVAARAEWLPLITALSRFVTKDPLGMTAVQEPARRIAALYNNVFTMRTVRIYLHHADVEAYSSSSARAQAALTLLPFLNVDVSGMTGVVTLASPTHAGGSSASSGSGSSGGAAAAAGPSDAGASAATATAAGAPSGSGRASLSIDSDGGATRAAAGPAPPTPASGQGQGGSLGFNAELYRQRSVIDGLSPVYPSLWPLHSAYLRQIKAAYQPIVRPPAPTAASIAIEAAAAQAVKPPISFLPSSDFKGAPAAAAVHAASPTRPLSVLAAAAVAAAAVSAPAAAAGSAGAALMSLMGAPTPAPASATTAPATTASVDVISMLGGSQGSSSASSS